MKEFAEDYVHGCAVCQENKPRTTHRKAPLQPITSDPHSGPFQMVAMDLITDLPKSNGFNAVLTIINHGCSKAAKFIPCTTNITREGVAALYLQHLVPWFGIPRKIISNHDPCFVSHFTMELCRLLHIQQNVSTAFHPCTNGASKRANQWLEQYLRIWTADDQTTWAQYLSLAEFVHNSWPHDRTTLTPHELLFGVKPPFPLSDEEAKTPDVTTRLRQIREARDKAEAALRVSKERLIPIDLDEGEQVWLEGRNLKTHHPTTKLAPRRYGPFLVDRKLSPVTYRLTLPPSMKIHPVFHVDLLTRYRETEAHGPNYERPPPDIIDGEPEWEIEKIIKSRFYGKRRNLQFLVRWKGFPPSEDSWVLESEMSAPDLIADFYETHPSMPRRKPGRRAL